MSHHDLHSPGTRPAADPGSPVANPNRQGPPRRPRPRVIAGTRRPRCRTPPGTRSAAHPGNLVARRTPAPVPGDRRYPQASMSHPDRHSRGARPSAHPGNLVANPNRQGPPHRPRPQVIAGTRRPRCHTPTARRPRCRTPTGTAPAPARRLIPVARWPIPIGRAHPTGPGPR